MTFLTPTRTYRANGLLVKERIIPFGLKSDKDIYFRGSLSLGKGQRFKADAYLKTENHIPTYITVHNTDDIIPSAGTTKSEQYSRACYPNQAMGTTRVHYYVDETEAWQNLLDTEIGWHASYPSPANDVSLSLEIIGPSAEAEENGAKLVAYLMKKYNIPIDKVVTHQSWTGKYCPCWIIPHWDKFIARVQEIAGGSSTSVTPSVSTNTNQTKDIKYIMKSLGQAAIRSKASKTGSVLSRCSKEKLYAFDQALTNEGGQWLRHAGTNKYSMRADGSVLFSKVGEYTTGETTTKINVRSAPGMTGSKLGILDAGSRIFMFKDFTPIEKDNFEWVKILYTEKNVEAYIAKKFVK